MDQNRIPVLRVVANFLLFYGAFGFILSVSFSLLCIWTKGAWGWLNLALGLSAIALLFWVSIKATSYWFSDWVAYRKPGPSAGEEYKASVKSAKSV